MEMEQFDDFTRHVSAAGSSRRQALRALRSLLLSGALGGMAARLGLTDDAIAKARKHGRRHEDRKQSGPLHATGKKGKKHNHHHKKPKDPPPPPPPACGAGRKRCPDGSCIPDLPSTCCAGQRSCGDEGCYPADRCCPSQTKCPDGSCHRLEQYECCPGQKSCGDEGCVPADQCCPGERQCGDGQCIREGPPNYRCCPGERECGDEGCFPADRCCPGSHICPDGSCVGLFECCPYMGSPCPNCNELVCVNGEYHCSPTPHESCSPGCEEEVCNEYGNWTCEFKASNCPACPAGTVSCPVMWRHERGAWCCPEEFYSYYQGRPFCSGQWYVYCDSETGY